MGESRSINYEISVLATPDNTIAHTHTLTDKPRDEKSGPRESPQVGHLELGSVRQYSGIKRTWTALPFNKSFKFQPTVRMSDK